MGRLTGITAEKQRRSVTESGYRYLHRSIQSCVAGLIAIMLFTGTAIATSGDGGSAGHSPGVFHVLLEFSQLLVGIAAVGTAIAGVQTMRGGRMEWAFYSLTGGVFMFLLQRMWHSVHEFGLVLSPPSTVEQLLFLTATGLMGLGFSQVYRVMR